MLGFRTCPNDGKNRFGTRNGNVAINSLTVEVDGILNLNGFRTFLFGGTATTTVNNSGAISLGNSSTFGLLNTVFNSGSLTANDTTSGGAASRLTVQTGNAILTGGGTTTLNGNNARIDGNSGTSFTIGDQTVQGEGSIGLNILGITNSANGTIDANLAGKTMTIDPMGAATVSWSNQGILRASNGGTLRSVHSLENDGTIDALLNSAVSSFIHQ